MTVYFITNWNELYENNRSRLVSNLKWVPIPNTHDGDAYSRLMRLKNAARVFSAWILMLQVASRCEPRGELVKSDGTAHDSASLALRTRAPASWFSEAIPILEEFGWLSHKELPDSELALGRQAGVSRLTSWCASTVTERREGREGKKEEKKGDAASPTPLPFDSDGFKASWELFVQHRREIRKPLTPTATTLTLEQLSRMGEQRAIAAIRHTIAKGWQGIREPDGAQMGQAHQPKPASKECPGWKGIINRCYPDSVYAAGGAREAHRWEDLGAEAQQLCWAEWRKAGGNAA